ncbi:hypothetical protein [Eubacterium sp.]|uniref:hypothetical protein n=1 Tax=Eubacterium sp. TaxID=142586 RepID=UPI0030DAA959
MIRPPFWDFIKSTGQNCPPGCLFLHSLWIIHIVVDQQALAAKALPCDRGQVFGKGDQGVDAPAVFDSRLVAQAAGSLQLCPGAAEGAVADAQIPLELVGADDKFCPPSSLAPKGGHRAGIVAVHQVVPEHMGRCRHWVIPMPAVKFLYLLNVINGRPPFLKTGS